MAFSLCEYFLGMKDICWKKERFLFRLKPFSNLIIDGVEDMGGYKGIRILHQTIASASLDELERSYGLKRKKDGDEREQFSSLTNRIHSQQGRQAIQEIFVKASSRYVTSVSIPQAVARYLYIYERDFSEALTWAKNAKDIKENPYTFDTIGQVYKSHLRSNMDREKQEMWHNPKDLHTNLTIANDAMKAFRRAQELADCQQEVQAESFDDDSEDYPRKSYNVYGYVRMLEIAFMVFDILSTLPLFEEHDPMKKHSLQSFLEKTIRISIVYKEDNDVNKRYAEILQDHEQFLGKLKSEVKKIFDLLNCYFVYIKGTCEFDKMNHRLVCQHFKKYVQLFCNTPQEKKSEQENNPHLKLKIEIEDRKMFLETTQADTFSGILQHLDRPPKEMEKITECYAFLLRESDNQQQRTKMTINYILSNIVLHHSCSKKSKHVKSYEELSALLLDTLQSVGLSYSFPDPYYLALLLFWPSPTEENTEICKYVTAIRKSSHRHLSKLFRRRSTIAKFYLAKENGLERLITKPKLDQSFPSKMKGRWHTLAQLWQNGDIFKENAIIRQLHRVSGTIEEGEVYANYGKVKIPVRPALLSGIRSGFSTEKVSFYLGFAINGPLAYDIKYDN